MATLLVFDALVSCCVKLSRRGRRVKSRPPWPPENGKIAAQTMARTVDFDRLEYEKRVNLVIDHVSAHLAEDLSLEGLARVAAFSPFHFHRIFRAISGETVFAFVQRLRLERAANALRYHGDRSILAVALDHGFSSAATFARAFKAHFGMSATDWRRGGAERWSNRGKANRNQGKARPRQRRPP